jgi:hypothetical protein
LLSGRTCSTRIARSGIWVELVPCPAAAWLASGLGCLACSVFKIFLKVAPIACSRDVGQTVLDVCNAVFFGLGVACMMKVYFRGFRVEWRAPWRRLVFATCMMPINSSRDPEYRLGIPNPVPDGTEFRQGNQFAHRAAASRRLLSAPSHSNSVKERLSCLFPLS